MDNAGPHEAAFSNLRKQFFPSPPSVSRSAAHEAGHALVALIRLPAASTWAIVKTPDPRSPMALATSSLGPIGERNRFQIIHSLQVLTAGAAAEMVVFGDAELHRRDFEAAVPVMDRMVEFYPKYDHASAWQVARDTCRMFFFKNIDKLLAIASLVDRDGEADLARLPFDVGSINFVDEGHMPRLMI